MWGERISLLIIFYWHQESKHPKVVQENLEHGLPEGSWQQVLWSQEIAQL